MEKSSRLLRVIGDDTLLWVSPRGDESIGYLHQGFMCVPIGMQKVGQWTWFKVLSDLGTGWVLEKWLEIAR